MGEAASVVFARRRAVDTSRTVPLAMVSASDNGAAFPDKAHHNPILLKMPLDFLLGGSLRILERIRTATGFGELFVGKAFVGDLRNGSRPVTEGRSTLILGGKLLWKTLMRERWIYPRYIFKTAHVQEKPWQVDSSLLSVCITLAF